MKKTTRRSWDMIPIIDKVIDRVNPILKCQESILVFTDHKVRLIGYGDVKLTEMDGYGDENEAPLNIENQNYLDYHNNHGRKYSSLQTTSWSTYCTVLSSKLGRHSL